MLRKYQEDCLDSIVRCFKEKQEGLWLVSIPTGGGKSFIIAEFLKRQICKCLIIQPSVEILRQNYEKYVSYGFRASIYSGKQKELSEDCVFCTLQSVYNKPQLFQDIECVIIDEVHAMDLERKRSMFSKFLSKISAKKILGFTATAYRNYYKTKWEYGSLYQETAFGMLTDQKAVNGFAYIISYKELMDEEYLKKIVYYQWDKTFDNNRLKLNSQGTNYDEKAVEEYTAREDRVATIMQAVLFTMTKRNKIIIYASCKKQALMLLEELKRHGIDCPFLSDSTVDSDREEIIRNFKESKKAIMMNLLILKQGFDDPSLDALIFCRPMKSIPYYIQIAGRLSRPDPNNPDKKPIFVDCTSTARNLGKIENYFILKDEADKYQLYDCVGLNKKQLTNGDCSKWKIR